MPIFQRSTRPSSDWVIRTALKKLMATPIPRVMAKPLTMSEPKKARMTQTIPVEMLLSRMAGKARRKPSSTEAATDLPWRSSSRVRSKISTLASTAIPTDNTKPARPARLTVTPMIL